MCSLSGGHSPAVTSHSRRLLTSAPTQSLTGSWVQSATVLSMSSHSQCRAYKLVHDRELICNTNRCSICDKDRLRKMEQRRIRLSARAARNAICAVPDVPVGTAAVAVAEVIAAVVAVVVAAAAQAPPSYPRVRHGIRCVRGARRELLASGRDGGPALAHDIALACLHEVARASGHHDAQAWARDDAQAWAVGRPA